MAALPNGAWRSLSDVPEQQKSAVFQVGPYFYNSSLVSLHSGYPVAHSIVN
jgi:hypothetical protein